MCCPKEQNKCQEIYYSNNVCMMQSSLDVLSCNRHGKGRFSLCRYVVLMKKISESWEPEGNVPPLL